MYCSLLLNIIMLNRHHKLHYINGDNHFRAAFERHSKIHYVPHMKDEQIDIRRTRLPSIRPTNDYNPLEHRSPRAPLKIWMAYFNLIRTQFGPGILIMPLAISQGGLILGPILTLFVGGLLIHTYRMLLDDLTEISRQLAIPYVSYRYGFRLAVLHGPPLLHGIGHHGPQIIATFMFMSQLGICTVFVILTTDSLRDLADWQSNEPAILALLFPYLLLEFLMKTLKIVSYVSLMGNFLNLIGMVLIFYQYTRDQYGETILATKDFAPMLYCCGASLFNLSAVAVILTIDKALKDAQDMRGRFGAITIGILVPTLVSIVFGVMGYMSFGTMEENVLRSLPLDEITSMMVLALYLVSVAFAYPIQCYPGIETIVEVIKYQEPFTVPTAKTLRLVETLGRPLFVLMTFFICYLVPFQAPFVAFVGHLCTSMLSLIFPALIDLCLRYPDHYGKFQWLLYKNIFIIAIGIIDWVFGVFFLGYILYIRILSNRSPNNLGYY